MHQQLTITQSVPVDPKLVNPGPVPTHPTQGQPWSYQFQISGGVPPYTFTPGPTGISAGYMLSPSGLVSTSAAPAGPLNLDVNVDDSGVG